MRLAQVFSQLQRRIRRIRRHIVSGNNKTESKAQLSKRKGSQSRLALRMDREPRKAERETSEWGF